MADESSSDFPYNNVAEGLHPEKQWKYSAFVAFLYDSGQNLAIAFLLKHWCQHFEVSAFAKQIAVVKQLIHYINYRGSL